MINNCVLIGRITFPLEIKRFPNNPDMVLIKNTLAVDRGKKSPDGEKVTDFIPFTVWGKSAEYLYNYAEKGNLIAVSGNLRIDSFEGKDGEKKKNFYVNCVNVSIVQSNEKKSYKKEEKRQENQQMFNSKDEDLPF